MEANKAIDWQKLKAVILDVDGTLYNQKGLRRKMLLSLLGFYALRPHRLQEMKILYHFRKERETRSLQPYQDLENSQYAWCAEKGFPLELVRSTVDRWMFSYPNRFLPRLVFPGLTTFLGELRQRGIRIAIYSDYKADDKLKSMEQLGVKGEECLFIGDRPELDGICAERAGMPYRIISRESSGAFYGELTRELTGALS
jgi:putative hydrolase of the HAD superfamily